MKQHYNEFVYSSSIWRWFAKSLGNLKVNRTFILFVFVFKCKVLYWTNVEVAQAGNQAYHIQHQRRTNIYMWYLISGDVIHKGHMHTLYDYLFSIFNVDSQVYGIIANFLAYRNNININTSHIDRWISILLQTL